MQKPVFWSRPSSPSRLALRLRLRSQRWLRSTLSVLSLSSLTLPAAAEPPHPTSPETYVQVWIGAIDSKNDSWKATDAQSGSDVVGDLGTLPFGGGDGQMLWGSGAWQIGYEGGGLASWKNETTHFSGASNGGTSVQVQFRNQFFLFGVFMGGVVSVRPAPWVRLYASAGPSLTWAWIEDDNNNNGSSQSSNSIDTHGSLNDGSFTAYGRAGVDFITSDGFMFGASVRYANDKFDFGDSGELKLDSPLYLLTLGARI